MYSVFQKCYESELRKLPSNEVNTLFMFSTYFTDLHYSQNTKKINAVGVSRHKFHIFINYYRNETISEEYRSIILNIFSNAQSRYMALLLFKNICKWKRIYKSASIVNTIEFDNLDDVPSYRKLDLVEDKVIYTFSIYDLIKIVIKSLSFHIELFTEVIKVKNPWTNKELPYVSLLSIYHFIHFNTRIMKMPLLLSRFYQANFNLKSFERNNDYIIKDTIIRTVRSEDNKEILKFIRMMISTYNRKYPSDSILFSNDFPDKRKMEYMTPFLENFMQSKYSIDEKNKQFNKMRFLSKMNKFKQANPLLGRSICCTYINKLFKLSLLYYHGKKMVEDYGNTIKGNVPSHLLYNNIQVNVSSRFTYPIPTIDMIDITNKVYWIGTKDTSNYTLFVDINKIQRNARSSHNNEEDKSVQRTFRDFLKYYKFNTSQEFYFRKFLRKYVTQNKENFKVHRGGRTTFQEDVTRLSLLRRMDTYIDRSRAPTPILDSESEEDDEDSSTESEVEEQVNYENNAMDESESEDTVMSDSESNGHGSAHILSGTDEIRILNEEEVTNISYNNDIGNNDSHTQAYDDDADEEEGNIDDDDTITVIEDDYSVASEDRPDTSRYYLQITQDNYLQNSVDVHDYSDIISQYPQAEMEYLSRSGDQEFMDDIFGYDTDYTGEGENRQGMSTENYDNGGSIMSGAAGASSNQDNDQFNQSDFIRMQDRIINSLPPSLVPLNSRVTPTTLQTVFRPIDMTRVNNVTPTASSSIAHWLLDYNGNNHSDSSRRGNYNPRNYQLDEEETRSGANLHDTNDENEDDDYDN